MTRRLGAWDCPYCRNKRILGNVFDCPGCGRPRPKGIRFYQIPDGPIVTPEIQKVLGSGGPNWYCEHCDSGNRDTDDKCWKCGAPRGSSPSHKVRDFKQGEHVPQSTKEAEAADDDGKSWIIPADDVYTESIEGEEEKKSDYFSSTRIIEGVKNILPEDFDFNKIKPYAIGIGIVVLAAILTVLIYQFFFNTHLETVRVDKFHWTQSVIVSEYQVVHESSWTTHPTDAYNIESDYKDTGRDVKVHDSWITVPYQDTCYESETYMDTCPRSVYHSRSCTGTRDNGDGSFDTYSYECGSYDTEYESCTKTRMVPYSCTKYRQDEVYHYEDVYDWYFTYDINKWMVVNNYPTKGDDHSPYFFTDYTLNDPFVNQKEDPRIGQQQKFDKPGKYTITFVSANKKIGDSGYFTWGYIEGDWYGFKENKDYEIEVNFVNVILKYPNP